MVPTPHQLRRLASSRAVTGPGGESARRLECLSCERLTDHVVGPATYAKDGTLLVQWWTCAECREGRTVG